VLNLAQILQSHALSFFHLSSPDLVLGMDANPEQRNLFGVVGQNPELARDGIWLRSSARRSSPCWPASASIPAWVVPGGVSAPLTADRRDAILQRIPDAMDRVRRTLDWYKQIFGDFDPEIRTFANFPSLFMGLVTGKGELEMYDGKLRIVDATGRIVVDQVDPRTYPEWMGEAVEPDSYLKSPYYKPLGYPDGIYRVGPLARLNLI
jgi:NAD-reducing hydrogenase large subunit